jgi:hypothetical protein
VNPLHGQQPSIWNIHTLMTMRVELNSKPNKSLQRMAYSHR